MYTVWASLLLAIALAACEGDTTDGPPTRRPTDVPPTPTPRAMPLADVPSAPRLGDPEWPVRVLIAVPTDSTTRQARSAARELDQHLEQDLGVNADVEFATQADAIAALCSGQPVAAWLSPFSYLQVQDTCAPTAALAIQRGQAPRRTLGQSADIVGRIDIDDIADFDRRVFCRSTEQSEFTRWVYPRLLMIEAGLDPATDLTAVYDYDDDLTVLEAIYRGDCAAAALEPGTFDDLADELASQLSTEEQPLTTAAITSVIHVVLPGGDVTLPVSGAAWDGFPPRVIPHELLVIAPALPDDLNTSLVTSIEDFFAERDDGTQRLLDLLNADAVFAVTMSDYTAFFEALAAVEWELAYLP